ncbi:MAG TPA: tyrosinase family protein [Allosphingosinicella sp.]|nr:tyrosinase family protein [Allosphingosinicella sp.]
MSNGETPISNPTYMGDIRHFFRDIDIDHMRDPDNGAVDLATYVGVKANALRLYFKVKDGEMPPGQRWSPARVETFYNWMKHDYPRGDGEPVALAAAPSEARRIRKNIKDVDIEKLKTAFRGLMNRRPEDPQSYYALAGQHWLPGGGKSVYYCRHHENAYNPWHRAYLLAFENALRSVEGCEDVTLPYWDITAAEIPAFLWEDPFDKYEIPVRLCPLAGDCYPPQGATANYVTDRYPAETILKNLADFGVAEIIGKALGQSRWELFNGWDNGNTGEGIITAHDAGHVASGVTMRNQDVTAFDPIFWFFHCNWDRLWWKWQQAYGATTLNKFKSHLAGAPDWLDDPVLNGLPPFTLTAPETIDSLSLGVDYEHPRDEPAVTVLPLRLGAFPASRAFALPGRPKVSFRVKEIDRLEIPGSFTVALRVGDRVIGKRAFFQPTTPKLCATCRANALANFDFLVDQADLEGGPVEVEIRLLTRDGGEVPFPFGRAGNPTVNARLLLER